MSDERDETIKAFKDAVNMSPAELERLFGRR